MKTAPAPDPAQSSLVAEQLQQGFPWLRFDPALEVQYQAERYQHGLMQIRINLLLVLGMALAFVAMDNQVLPRNDGYVAWLRYGVFIPTLLLGLAISFVPNSARLYRRASTVFAPVLIIALIVLVLGAGETASAIVFPALLLAAIYVYYLIGMTFYAAVAANAIGLAAFILGALLVDIPSVQTFHQTMVLFFANVIGATVAYSLEKAQRTGWLEARLLAEMAERDGLTGVYNRRRLDIHLRRAWQQGIREQQPVALLMIDIDFFKPYNDRYGHQAGDEALKAVASVLARTARRPLDFVARYGGEEFLIVLYDTTREYAGEVARNVVSGVRDLRIQHAASSVARVLTVSVGVAYVVPVAGRSADGLVQLADEALYAAKNGGRNRVHVMESEYAQLRTGSFRIAQG